MKASAQHASVVSGKSALANKLTVDLEENYSKSVLECEGLTTDIIIPQSYHSRLITGVPTHLAQHLAKPLDLLKT
jgi:hypothetical protein